MNWLVLIVSFAIAAMVGAFLAAMFERSRPEWSPRRRLWAAALALPGFIALSTLFAIGCTMATISEGGEGNRDLVSAVYTMVGGLFFLITLAGGLAGAFAALRKDRQ